MGSWFFAWGGAAVYINCIHKTFTILYISPREFLAATFVMIGYCFALFEMKKFSNVVIIFSFIALFLNSSYNFLRMKSDFYDTDKIIPYAITAVLATWSVYSLPWNRLKGIAARTMLYIGNNTLPVLIWHFIMFKIVSLLIILCYGLPMYELGAFHVIYRYADKGWFLLYTFVGVFMPITIVFMFRRIFQYVNSIKSQWIKYSLSLFLHTIWRHCLTSVLPLWFLMTKNYERNLM